LKHFRYLERSSKILAELQRTYRLLFENEEARTSRQKLSDYFTFARKANDNVGLSTRGVRRLDVNKSHPRKVMKSYLDCPPPEYISEFLERIGETEKLRCKFGSRKAKLSDVLDNGPPYPLDIWMHMEAILDPQFETPPCFSSYPLFGDRLRELKAYMDRQKPKSLWAIWKDRRDTVSYFTFWAVIVIGGVGILLALVSIAVSSAQTVAAFEALGGTSQHDG
jgi:hypothetical protein